MFQKPLQREEVSAVIVVGTFRELWCTWKKVVLYSGYGCGNRKHHVNRLLDGLGHM